MQNFEDMPKGCTPEKLDELKAEHGEIYLIRHPDGEFPPVIVKKPSKTEYNRFKSEASHDRKAVADKAVTGFFNRHVVYPARGDLDVILEQYPALEDAYGKKLLELAGMVENAEAKKL